MSQLILVAEPSRTLAALIRLTLDPLGADIEFASDGREALAAARHRLPDLVIADAALPGLDGYALAGSIRKLSPHPKPAILLTVTGHTPTDTERIAYLGIDDTLAKPFERVALLERVRALLGLPSLPPEHGRRVHRIHRQTRQLNTATEHNRAFAQHAAVAPTVDGMPRPGPQQMPGPHAQPPAAHAAPFTSEDDLTAAVESVVARRLPEVVAGIAEAELSKLLPHALDRAIRELLPQLVDAAVRTHLPDAAAAGVSEAMKDIAGEELRRSANEAVAKAMPEMMDYAAFGLGPKVEVALRDVLPGQVTAIAERIIWKVIPEMAENLIRDEIQRLTKDD